MSWTMLFPRANNIKLTIWTAGCPKHELIITCESTIFLVHNYHYHYYYYPMLYYNDINACTAS